MTPQIYFIFALPRSRTSWLANWLTWGPSFCIHDGLRHCERLSDLAALFAQAARRDPGRQFIGDSDSALCYFWRELLELFPEAKAVFIRRPPAQALQSFLHFVARHPFRGQPPVDGQAMAEIFQLQENELGRAQEAWPAAQSYTADCDSLNYEHIARGLWRFLLGPDVPFQLDRFLMLSGFRIEPFPARIEIDWERAGRLLASSRAVRELVLRRDEAARAKQRENEKEKLCHLER